MKILSFGLPKQQANEFYDTVSQISNDVQSSFSKTLQSFSDQNLDQVSGIKDFVSLNQGYIADKSLSTQFCDAIQNGLSNVRKKFRRAEISSIESLLNKGDAADLMASLTEAQITLKTAKAVIEKIIEMYKQFENMPL